jgi:hypothetical protein
MKTKEIPLTKFLISLIKGPTKDLSILGDLIFLTIFEQSEATITCWRFISFA